MARNKPQDPKTAALRQQGCLNPRADRVKDPLFADTEFFDARDLVQVKYEMVRRVRVDGQPVSGSAAAFGFSRPAYYHAQAVLERGGLAALVPKRPGPRRSHKLSEEVIDFILQEQVENPSLRSPELASRVHQRFGCKVHPRSVERALSRREKKGP